MGPSGRHLVCLETDFQDHFPAETDRAVIGLVDLATERYEPLAEMDVSQVVQR